MPELQILNGDLQWKTVRMDGGRFVIGRKDQCHLVLKDGWVSREHTLVFEPRAGEYFVKDLGSENGTYLNGERIDEGRLKSGDVLRIGRTEMKFLALTSASDTPVRLASPGPVGARTESRPLETTFADEPETTPGSARPPGEGRAGVDHRERVRRLEKRVLELEMENARLAAENAVLRRATTRPAPATKVATPSFAFVGFGASGRKMIERFVATGETRAKAVDAHPRNEAALAVELAALDVANRPLLLCAGAFELDGPSVELILGVARSAGASGVYVFVVLPPQAKVDSRDAAHVEALYAQIRGLSEAGRLKGVLLRSDEDPKDAADALRAVLSAPGTPSPEGAASIGWEDLAEVLAAPGYAVPAVVPFEGGADDVVEAAVKAATDVGLIVRLAPTARARAAAAWLKIASGPSSAGRFDVKAMEAALYPVLGLVPQARVRRGLHVQGEGNAAVALVGGLTFPTRVYGDRA
jgi:pSer/pThr/pTyr-binding forkhead associated (FHA) protein